MPAVLVLAVVSLFALTSAAAATSGPRTPRSFDYLHLEANAGGSSGGHAAICFDEHCYDFQQAEHRTIRLRRQSIRQFEHFYRVIDNRAIHATNVAVSEDTYERLQATFESYHRIQEAQFEILAALGMDRAVLAHMLARVRRQNDGGPPPPLRIPGSGYFAAEELDQPQTPGKREIEMVPVAPSTRAVAGRVSDDYGPDILARRAGELRDDIRLLTPPIRADPLDALSSTRLPLAESTFAERYGEMLSGLLAIQVLRGTVPLRASSLVACPHSDCTLSPAEVRILEAFAARLERSLARLVVSKRPDWGYPLLVGLARLAALDASIRSQHLTLLDVFREDAAVISSETLQHHRDAFVLLLDERQSDFRASRAAFFASEEAGELHLSRLEVAANRLTELAQARREGSGMRVHDEELAPMRGTLRAAWFVPQASEKQWERAHDAARSREQAYERELRRLYPYDMIQRNCVTEIFRTVEASFEPGAPARRGGTEAKRRIREQSVRRLGGHVDRQNSLNFIPFVSARAVSASYRASAPTRRPSRRSAAMQRMLASEPDLLVYLRESNVLTARAYEPNESDSTFLFFSEEPRLARPLFGGINLAVGLGAIAVGLVALPFDGGATVRSAAEGVLFSLPELLFVNLRKGSYPFSPEGWLDVADATAAADADPKAVAPACSSVPNIARSAARLGTDSPCGTR